MRERQKRTGHKSTVHRVIVSDRSPRRGQCLETEKQNGDRKEDREEMRGPPGISRASRYRAKDGGESARHRPTIAASRYRPEPGPYKLDNPIRSSQRGHQ